MHEDSNIAVRCSQDGGDVFDGQLVDDTQHHRRRHLIGQRRHQGHCPVDRRIAFLLDVRTVRGSNGVGGTNRQAVLTHGSTDRIDRAAVRNGEQPSTEVVGATIEPGDRRGNVHPHLRRHILGRDRATATQVPQDGCLVRSPQLGERRSVTDARPTEDIGVGSHAPTSAPDARNLSNAVRTESRTRLVTTDERRHHAAMTSDDTAAPPQRIRREPPRFRRVRVRSKRPLSERMLRIVLGGDELDGFAIPSPASSVRLLLPAPGSGALEMPIWTGNQFELATGERAPIRTFTPRAFDADRRELTLDVVIHDHGAATDWARRADIGDEAAISGPGRSETLDPDARSLLLAGDESAIPAIAQLLEWLDADCTIDVHIEVAHPDARFDLPEHPQATITWHDAADGARPGSSIVDVVRRLDALPDAVWVAGEAAAVQRLRTHLFDERGRNRKSVTARGYWKLGRSAT